MIAYQSIRRNIVEHTLVEKLLLIQRDLALDLTIANTIQKAFKKMMNAILKMEPIDSGGIYLFDDTTKQLNLSYYKGFSDNFAENIKNLDYDSKQKNLIMSGEILYKEFSTDIPELENEKLKTVGIIPITLCKKFIAALFIASHTSNKYPSYVKTAVESIAGHAGRSILAIQKDERIMESQKNLQHMLDSIEDLLIILDMSGNIKMVNQTVIKKLGYSFDELIGMNISKINAPRNKENIKKVMADIKNDNISLSNIPF